MTVTVQTSDVNGTALQTAVSSAQTAYNAATAASPVNQALVTELLLGLTNAQIALINYLMSNAFAQRPAQLGVGSFNFLTPAGILSVGSVNT